MASLDVFFTGGNMVFQVLLASQKEFWNDTTVKLANGYIQALHAAASLLDAKQIALQYSKARDAEAFFISMKKLIDFDEAEELAGRGKRFPATIKFVPYWNDLLPEIQRYCNLS